MVDPAGVVLASEICVASNLPQIRSYLVGWRGYFGFCETPSCCAILTDGQGDGCGPSPGSNGKADAGTYGGVGGEGSRESPCPIVDGCLAIT